jgi:signal peptidase I
MANRSDFPPKTLGLLVETVIGRGRNFTFRVKGNSMHPLIRNGDVITLMRASPEELVLGDVVAYVERWSGRLAVHRIIWKRRGAYYIKGDNAAGVVTISEPKAILGRVCTVMRRQRRVTIGLGHEGIMIALLSMVGFIARRLRHHCHRRLQQ